MRKVVTLLCVGILVGCGDGDPPQPSDYALYSVALDALADSGFVPLVIRRTGSFGRWWSGSPELVFDTAMTTRSADEGFPSHRRLVELARSRSREEPRIVDSLDVVAEYLFLDDAWDRILQNSSPAEVYAVADSLFPEGPKVLCLTPPAVRNDRAMVVVSQNCWDGFAFLGYYFVLERRSGAWQIVDQWEMSIN